VTGIVGIVKDPNKAEQKWEGRLIFLKTCNKIQQVYGFFLS
jgi:hypothetical protein